MCSLAFSVCVSGGSVCVGVLVCLVVCRVCVQWRVVVCRVVLVAVVCVCVFSVSCSVCVCVSVSCSVCRDSGGSVS